MNAQPDLVRLTGQGADDCTQGDCPNVYRTSTGSLVIQGPVFDGLAPPSGEGLVEIPENVLREAVRVLGW